MKDHKGSPNLRTFNIRKGSLGTQSGVSLVEFAIILPLMLLLLAGVIDVARGLVSYYAVTRVAYEGARYAATVPNLTPGTFNSSSSPNPSHQMVKERIDKLLVLYGLAPDTAVLESTRYFDAAAVIPVIPGAISFPSPDPARIPNNSIVISISVPYTSLLPFFTNITRLTSRMVGPYFYFN